MHIKTYSVFSDVVSKFSWFRNHRFRNFVATLPYVVIGFVFLFLEIWYLCTPASTIKNAIVKLEGSSGGMDFKESVLLGNAVLVVIVSAIFLLFKDSLLDFGKFKETVEHIEKTILAIINKNKSESSLHVERGYPDMFVAESTDDFMALKLPNNTLGTFSKRTYQIAYMLIFLSTAWAILDFPLRVVPTTANMWQEYRIILGLFLSSLAIMTIGIYGVLYIPVKLLRANVRESLQEDNIIRKYFQFVRESEESNTKQKAQEAIQRIDEIIPPH